MPTKAQLEEKILELKIRLDAQPEFANQVNNNKVTGVHWDAQALSSVDKVAQGLLNMTNLFASQKIVIETAIGVNADKTIIADTEVEGRYF